MEFCATKAESLTFVKICGILHYKSRKFDICENLWNFAPQKQKVWHLWKFVEFCATKAESLTFVKICGILHYKSRKFDICENLWNFAPQKQKVWHLWKFVEFCATKAESLTFVKICTYKNLQMFWTIVSKKTGFQI